MRRGAAWLVTLPLALVGVAAAHALANAAFGSPEEAAEIFASAGSGEELLPVVSAVALGAVLLGLGVRVACGSLSPYRRVVALPFAGLPPVAFVLLELLEGVLHRGSVPWDVPFEPAFVVGLPLQLPFALAGYRAARLLLRLSDALRGLIVRDRVRPQIEPPPAFTPRPHDDQPRRARRGYAYSGRAPPSGLSVAG